MPKQKVTLSIDSKVYKEFQKFCKEADILPSLRIERFMKKDTTTLKKAKKVLDE